MIREGLEDNARHKSDVELNSSECTIFREGKMVRCKWSDLLVGDVCYVVDNEVN